MDLVRVVTNETCNHRCRFCNARRDHERPSVAGPTAIRAQIDRAVEASARDVLLTGGEPTLRRDLPRIVAYARHRGLARVGLETNATQIDATVAHALADAGLSFARVHLPAWGDALDAITAQRSLGATIFMRWRTAPMTSEAVVEVKCSSPMVTSPRCHMRPISRATGTRTWIRASRGGRPASRASRMQAIAARRSPSSRATM